MPTPCNIPERDQQDALLCIFVQERLDVLVLEYIALPRPRVDANSCGDHVDIFPAHLNRRCLEDKRRRGDHTIGRLSEIDHVGRDVSQDWPMSLSPVELYAGLRLYAPEPGGGPGTFSCSRS
jgi:hypothetical protein